MSNADGSVAAASFIHSTTRGETSTAAFTQRIFIYIIYIYRCMYIFIANERVKPILKIQSM